MKLNAFQSKIVNTTACFIGCIRFFFAFHTYCQRVTMLNIYILFIYSNLYNLLLLFIISEQLNKCYGEKCLFLFSSMFIVWRVNILKITAYLVKRKTSHLTGNWMCAGCLLPCLLEIGVLERKSNVVTIVVNYCDLNLIHYLNIGNGE